MKIINVNNPKARAVVMEFLDDLEYTDAYRQINDDKKGFTWKKLNPDKKKTGQVRFFLNKF